jgi:hypothetical protein
MRTFVILFTLAATVFTKTSFANEGTAIAPEVLRSFQTTFTTAKDANWTVTADLYKVQFALNGQHITAFYKQDGTMAAVTRNINSMQLPVNLQTTLKNEYKGYWIAGLFELSNEEGVQYYVTLEDANSTLVLKSSACSWSVFQKQRKD